jgi:hypothetical protein
MPGHTDCSISDEVVAALEARMQSGPFRRDDLIALVVEMTGMHRVDADTAVGYRLQKARKAGSIQVARSNRFVWIPTALMKPRRIREVSDEEHRAAIEVDLALERFLAEMERLGYAKLCIPCRARFAVSITRTLLPRERKSMRHYVVAGLYRLIDWLTPYSQLPADGESTNDSCTR